MKKATAVSTFKKLGLTRREAEVLLWIVRGQSNAEIAAFLRISPLTVKKHLEHVYTKLGVKTRLAAAVRAGKACSARSALRVRPSTSGLEQDHITIPAMLSSRIKMSTG